MSHTTPTSFHERRRLAISKWGQALQRPQLVDPHFLDFRRDINNFDFSSIKCHPFHNAISSWKPSTTMFQKFNLPEINQATWIDTEEKLQEMAAKLESESVLAMDFEGNSDNSYYDMTCLWQISTKEHNYIVDCLKLYSFMSTYLGPIMGNEKILKIVHDAGDIVNLQRDFNIFVQALIDMQEVYAFIDPEVPNISFKLLVSSFLGYTIDKLPQLADWRLRPLPEDMKEYAINDSRFLLKCWFLIIAESNLDPCNFARSKKYMQKCFGSSKSLNPAMQWRQSILKLHVSCRPLFDNSKSEALFMSLYSWREDKCKYYDMSPNQFLPFEKLAFITRGKPLTESNLISIFNGVKKWPSGCISEVFKLIQNYETQVLENVSVPGVAPVVKQNFELMELCSDVSDDESDDWSVEHMIIEVPNDLPPPSPVLPIQPNLGQNVENRRFLSAKNKQNVLKRIRLWGNRFKRNQERVAKGLVPIRYRRYKGEKHKNRLSQKKAQ